jgi:hypothetical protein
MRRELRAILHGGPEKGCWPDGVDATAYVASSSAHGYVVIRADSLSAVTLTARVIRYNRADMQRKVFWLTFSALGIIADLALPFWWAMAATIPVGMLAWWIAYRSDWF